MANRMHDAKWMPGAALPEVGRLPTAAWLPKAAPMKGRISMTDLLRVRMERIGTHGFRTLLSRFDGRVSQNVRESITFQ